MAKKTKNKVAKKSGPVKKGHEVSKKVVSIAKKGSPARKIEKVSPVAPLHDRVLIEELGEVSAQRTTASGFILPESADKDTGGKRGKVIAVGSGKYEHGMHVPMAVGVGDIVLYTWGDKISLEGKEYTIVQESAIIAILN